MNVSLNYALHSLWRSRTRTLVSLLGLGLGGAIALLTSAWLRGESSMIARTTAHSGSGYLQVVPAGWSETRDPRLRVAGYEELRQSLLARDEVTVVAPQVEVEALLGMGTKVQGVGLLGVDPIEEPKIRRVVRGISQGRYLQAGDTNKVVLGSELAKRLDVELEDELVVTAVTPSGDMNSALLSVVGIIRSGSRNMDASIAHVSLATAISLSGRPGVSRLALLVSDPSHLAELVTRLSPLVDDRAPRPPEILTWVQVNPGLVAGQQSDAAFGNLMVFVVCLLVVLGVTSAQLTGVLQRGREFSVLLALGMRPGRLARLVFTEAGLLGLGGGLLSLLLAAAPLWYLARVGLDISEVMGEEGMAMGGVLMDPVIKADVGLWTLGFAFVFSFFTALLGAVYPSWWSRRLDPATTLRARN